MKQDTNYTHTVYACFAAYVMQAIVNNFAPLLFVTFQRSYDIPLSQITALVTVNFAVQLLIDLLSAGVVDKIGYRACTVFAHFCAAAGLILLPILPAVCPSPFVGILIAVVIYAVGGGLAEVLISPIVEACPTPADQKEKAMSLLHSFYCWGHMAVVLISTAFFKLFGIENWQVLSCIWALLPIVNGFVFMRVPIATLVEEGESGMSIRRLCTSKIFWILMLMMTAAGASEQAVSQWASAFAEKGLGVSKAVGDLAGPMAFAAAMGLSRAFYGKKGDKLDLDRFMALSALLCIGSYLCISLVGSPVIGLAGCAVCGLSVGIMWPGTFSKAASALRGGGTAMFALLALAGDLGCSGGPTLAGAVSGAFGDDLRKGILAAIIFPILLLIGLFLCRKSGRTSHN